MKIKFTALLFIQLCFWMNQINAQSFTVSTNNANNEVAYYDYSSSPFYNEVFVEVLQPGVTLAWKHLDDSYMPNNWNISCNLLVENFYQACDQAQGSFIPLGNFSIVKEIGLFPDSGSGECISNFLIYDLNDSLNNHEIITFTTTINQIIIDANTPRDTSYQLFTVQSSNEYRHELSIPLSGTTDILWRQLNQVVEPMNWGYACQVESGFNYYPCEDESGFLFNTGNGTGIMSQVINLFDNEEGKLSTDYLVFDPSDLDNHLKIHTLISEIELPLIEGPTFSVVEDTVISYYDIASINDFPAYLSNSIVIVNTHPFDEVDLKWEKVAFDIPADWMYSCDLYTPSEIVNCDINSGQFAVEHGGFTDITRDLMVESAPASGAALSRYLVYDANDSLQSHAYLTFIDSLFVPTFSGGSFDLQSPDTHTTTETVFPQQPDVQVVHTFDFNKNSIDFLTLNWKKITDIRPPEWEAALTMEVFPDALDIFDLSFEEEGSFELMPESDFFHVDFFTFINPNGVNGELILQVLLYDPTDSLASNQLLTVNLSICHDMTYADIVIDPVPNVYCEGDSILLTANDSFNNVNWAPGVTGTMVETEVQTLFNISATDNLGCTYQDTLAIDISYPHNESICIVSVDPTTNKNVVVWEKTDGVDTEQFNIYKETAQANEFEWIASVPFDSLSAYVDESSNPEQSSERYKIATVNECGNESQLSSAHKTMHLTINQGLANINLIWDRYVGFTYGTFNIYRAIDDPEAMSLIAEQPSGNFTYTDVNPPVGNLYYKIEVVKDDACTATRDDDYLSSSSNIVERLATDVNELALSPIKLYPNPATTNLTIELPITENELDLQIKDISGRLMIDQQKITSNRVNVDISQVPNGVFIVLLKGEKIYRTKLIIEK